MPELKINLTTKIYENFNDAKDDYETYENSVRKALDLFLEKQKQFIEPDVSTVVEDLKIPALELPKIIHKE